MWPRELYLKFAKRKPTTKNLFGAELQEFAANKYSASARYALDKWQEELNDEERQVLLDAEILGTIEAQCMKLIRMGNDE